MKKSSFWLLVLLALAPAPNVPAKSAKKRAWPVYKGAWFAIAYPPGFKVRPGQRSKTSDEGSNSAFFTSPDKTVEFYVFSPQWNGQPTEILLNSKTESVVDRSTEESRPKPYSHVFVRQATLRAKNGSYTRSYLDREDVELNTRATFGFKYRNQQAYRRYRAAYLKFKDSLQQFAD